MKVLLLEVLFLLSTTTFSVECQQPPVLLGPLEAILGETLEITCFSPIGNVQAVRIGEAATVVTDRITCEIVNDTHKIFFLNNTTKTDNGRMFTCAVSDLRSQPATVTILYLDSIDFTPNDDIQDGVLALAENNSSEVVSFNIVGNPPQANNIDLTRSDGMPVNTERLQVTNQALMIVSASRNDSGMYNLAFTHRATVNVTVFEFSLDIQYPPEIKVNVTGANTPCSPVMMDYNCSTILGTEVVITCRVSANPQATLSFMSVGDNVRRENAQIIITNFNMGNVGEYQCTANNTVVGVEEQRTVSVELSLIDGPVTGTSSPTVSAGTMILSRNLLIIATLLISVLFLF